MKTPDGQPSVIITIERGSRTVFVNGVGYGKGVHQPDITFSNPAEPSIKIGQGSKTRTVSMDGDGLREIHIDGSAEKPPVTVVYGRYDELPGANSQAKGLAVAAAKTWECIWCQGEVLVCAVDPTCSGDIRL